MKKIYKSAEELHENVPKNWYFESIRVDIFQRFWHKRRFEEVSAVIEPVKGKILDIGCNDGTFSKVIFDKSGANQLVGMDVVEKTIDWAKNHWGKTGKMKFIVADAHKLPFESETFDAVFALEVLEHVIDPAKVLNEIKKVLKADGYAVFLVPSDSLLFRTIWFIWLNFYPRGNVWRETHIQTY
ncbi:MAG: class I SAM-dependent methyltransferase, partial [Candidatus Woesebacteria bacterium]|nr:class I SAM-dependent methyltransferase [Candidatus Woesebacteria bacterium]